METISESEHEAFAKKYCTSVYSAHGGQACVVITYPFKGTVVMYDMDAAEFFHIDLDHFFDFVEKVCRKSEEQDFSWSPILDSDYADDAQDISYHLFNG